MSSEDADAAAGAAAARQNALACQVVDVFPIFSFSSSFSSSFFVCQVVDASFFYFSSPFFGCQVDVSKHISVWSALKISSKKYVLSVLDVSRHILFGLL